MMNSDSFRLTSCRLCKEKNFDLLLSLPPTPIADAYVSKEETEIQQKIYPLDLVMCHNCHFIFLLDVVHPDILYKNYLYETSTSPGLVKHFEDYADNIIHKFSLTSNMFIIEIGSNDGTLLQCFKQKGFQVLGVDAAPQVAQKATHQGIETMPDYFNDGIAHKIKKTKGTADIIIANNIVANVDNLFSFFHGIKELLAPDGLFIFESGYLLNMVKNMVFDNIYHEHLSYLSVKPLQCFLKKNGLELIDAEIVQTKGGSLRCEVQLEGGKRIVSERVKKQIKIEETEGLYELSTYKLYSNKLQDTKFQFFNLLKQFYNQGKTTSGFGASASVTTVLYYMGIAPFLNCLIDDNEKKQNLLSPGYHLPVISSPDMYKLKPDYIVILPWRFSNLIIEKHKKYLDEGGHFIEFLPEVRII